jgi:hypothetical protein
MIRPAYTASEAANLLRISTMSNASLAGCSILICEDEPPIDRHCRCLLKCGRARSDGAVTCPGVHCHRRRRSVSRHLGSC